METPADRRAAANFLARTIGLDNRYISHGEIQHGLSPDGARWADDLEARFLDNLAREDPDRGVLLARDASGEIVGAAIARWVVTRPARFAVLEDLAIAPDLRSNGLGARMIATVEAEARHRDLGWVFLESGKDNLRAHAFFERHAFEEVSHVFAKRL